MNTSSTAWQQVGTASWYGKDFHGRPTASGEIYDMHGLSAAHKTLPLGTLVRVTNLDNGRRVDVPINDRGPFVGRRIIDMSYGAAKQLDMVQEGLAKVHVQVIQTPRTYTYNYILQFGAFTERRNAVTMADKLTSIGYSPSIEETTIQGRQFYRVRLGAFQSLKKAQSLAGAFRTKGLVCVIVGQKQQQES
ncbi:MAG: septal ring lytic transglycosylase RlpA family protein [Deltaproteobacteria bacterium]|nr:septal ring lytic transglycosylase RlpA family protein [Deltaproteobacteria bacterium]